MGRKMKPYAYAVVQGADGMENVSLQFDHPEMCGQKYKDAIPLFANLPKELTNEEIDEVALSNMEGVGRLIYMVQGNVKGCDFKEAVRSFAKAILRKASER